MKTYIIYNIFFSDFNDFKKYLFKFYCLKSCDRTYPSSNIISFREGGNNHIQVFKGGDNHIIFKYIWGANHIVYAGLTNVKT